MKFVTLILTSAVVASVEASAEITSAVKTWKQGGDPENLDDAMAHVDKLTDKDDVTSLLDDAMAHVEILSAIDDAFAHIETKDDSSDLTVALDEAMAHVDMLTAIDEAIDHIDLMTAIDDSMDFIKKHQASGSGYSIPIIVFADVLLLIGAGFVIKN